MPNKPLSDTERERRRQQRLASLRRGYSVNEWCAAFGRSRATA
jgi:hypothetical protein